MHIEDIDPYKNESESLQLKEKYTEKGKIWTIK